jgi:hypothetical protein
MSKEPILSEDVYSGKFRGCNVMVTKDAGLYHLSLSRKDRLPSYDELKQARYQFLPDVPYVVQIFPPQEDFVNVHDFCLHLWEPKDFVYSELNVKNFLEAKL